MFCIVLLCSIFLVFILCAVDMWLDETLKFNGMWPARLRKKSRKNFSNQFFYTLNNPIRIVRKYGIKLVWNFILFFLLRYIEIPLKAIFCICTRFMLEINESQPTKKISMKQEEKKAAKLLFRFSANKWNKKAGRNLSKN